MQMWRHLEGSGVPEGVFLSVGGPGAGEGGPAVGSTTKRQPGGEQLAEANHRGTCTVSGGGESGTNGADLWVIRAYLLIGIRRELFKES